MSDTLDALAIYNIEAHIRRDRAPFHCVDYNEISRSIPLCVQCGWPFAVYHQEHDGDPEEENTSKIGLDIWHYICYNEDRRTTSCS